ncbi:MAG: hypothetical protein ACXWV0_07650 [Flavisolibacter sp.]
MYIGLPKQMSPMEGQQVQEFLFQRIREKLHSNESLVDVVAELLHLSNDSAYRRIRGETPLVLEEARLLCETYSISLDEMLKARPDTVSFSSIQVENNHQSFELYLEGILKNLQYLNAAEQKELIYLTKDIPLFYNFLFRPLFAFRYFFWMKSILQHPDFISIPFSPELLPAHLEATGNKINEAYNSIPSTEIWNTECINSTIAQVEYYREAGYFNSEDDIRIIYNALHDLVEHLRDQAETGSKFLPAENSGMKKNNFLFFYNRVVLGDNTIMTLANHKKTLYLSYDVLNYMITRDEGLCNKVYDQLQMLMRRATILSNTSEKQRNIFFNILLKKIPQS